MGSEKKASDKVTGSSEHMSDLQQAEDYGFASLFSPFDEHVEKHPQPSLESTHTSEFSPVDEHFDKSPSTSTHEEVFSPAIEHPDKFPSFARHVDADGIEESLSPAIEHLPELSSPTVSDVNSDGYSGIVNNAGCVTQPNGITVFAYMGSTPRRAIKASLNWTADELHSIVSTNCGCGADIERTVLIYKDPASTATSGQANRLNGTVTVGQAGIMNNAIVDLVFQTYGG